MYYHLVVVEKEKKEMVLIWLEAIQVILVTYIDIGGRTLGHWVANPDTKLPTKLSCAPGIGLSTEAVLTGSRALMK